MSYFDSDLLARLVEIEYRMWYDGGDSESLKTLQEILREISSGECFEKCFEDGKVKGDSEGYSEGFSDGFDKGCEDMKFEVTHKLKERHYNQDVIDVVKDCFVSTY